MSAPAPPVATAGSRGLFGPTALVTGASDGIGEAFARELASRGLDLVLVARRTDRLEALAAELRASHGTTTRALAADLGDPEGVARVIEGTLSDDIGLLVAAAGFWTSGSFLDQPVEPELDMIDVNCRAVAALTHAVGRRLVARGRGGIVLMSSIVAFQGVPRSANYAATKAFIQSFAEGLHEELKPHGVDVLASAPGPVASGFALRANMRMGATDLPSAVAVATLDALGRATTVRPGRLGKLLGYSLSTLPRRARVRVMAQIMKGMTKDGAPVGQDVPASRRARA